MVPARGQHADSRSLPRGFSGKARQCKGTSLVIVQETLCSVRSRIGFRWKVKPDLFGGGKIVNSGRLWGWDCQESLTLSFTFFSIALIFSQQVCLSFRIKTVKTFHFETITVRPPETSGEDRPWPVECSAILQFLPHRVRPPAVESASAEQLVPESHTRGTVLLPPHVAWPRPGWAGPGDLAPFLRCGWLAVY